jgi:mRNA interferase MazF
MVIQQGDVFWVNLGKPSGSRPAYRHPCVVIQNNVFNRSAISTVVVCALTSNIARSHAPGNVKVSRGEANLPKPSVANVSQLFTADKADLAVKIGTLSGSRVLEIIDGINLLLTPRDIQE